MRRTLAVLQLVAVSVCGAGGVRAPQTPGISLCSVSNGDPCVHSCASGTYDLSSFAPTAAQGKPYWQVTDSESHAYFFKACGAVAAVTCQGTSTQAPVAIQTFSSPAPPSPFPSDSCVGLGDLSTASCAAAPSRCAKSCAHYIHIFTPPAARARIFACVCNSRSARCTLPPVAAATPATGRR